MAPCRLRVQFATVKKNVSGGHCVCWYRYRSASRSAGESYVGGRDLKLLVWLRRYTSSAITGISLTQMIVPAETVSRYETAFCHTCLIRNSWASAELLQSIEYMYIGHVCPYGANENGLDSWLPTSRTAKPCYIYIGWPKSDRDAVSLRQHCSWIVIPSSPHFCRKNILGYPQSRESLEWFGFVGQHWHSGGSIYAHIIF